MKKILIMIIFTQFMVSAFSQSSVPLDNGFSEGIKYFETRIKKGTKLVVLNFKTVSPALSEYIMEELTVYFVNSGSFTVVDRSNLALLQQEMAFQLSGDVSDETALSIGKMLGAHTIVSGSFDPLGDIFRLRIRAIAVESAAIQGIYTVNIQRDRLLTSLAGTSNTNSNTNENVPKKTSTQSGQSAQTGNNESRVLLPDYLLSN